MPRPALAFVLLAALAACDKSGGNDASAAGRVLEGTVSDAMLPVDTVTSEPPLAEPTAAASGKPGKAKDGSQENASKDSEPSAAPAAEATPEAQGSAAPTEAND